MNLDLAVGNDLTTDTLLYASMILISFGIGWQLEDWLAQSNLLPVILYGAFLFFIYMRWIVAGHR